MTARTTEIEWTQHTWNPFVGCTRVSAGCINCYAVGMAARCEAFGSAPHYAGVTRRAPGGAQWTGKIAMAPDHILRKPEGIAAPSLIFANSMSDFWHVGATDAMRRAVLEVMDRTPRHAYQVLTKRPENILPGIASLGRELPANFWAGATVENSAAKPRIDLLRAVPVRTRFLSIEPLLDDLGALNLSGIDWVIVGGESGPRARPMRAEWVRSIRDQCLAQNVPLFFKQWGAAGNNPLFEGSKSDLALADPIGKGGSLLDGQHHKAMPAGWASPSMAGSAQGSLLALRQ